MIGASPTFQRQNFIFSINSWYQIVLLPEVLLQNTTLFTSDIPTKNFHMVTKN